MLKINLLPIRQLKQRAKATNQIASAFVAFCCVLLVLALIGFFQSSNIKAVEDQITALEAEKRSYSKTLKKIAEYKKNTEELNRRIEVINSLKKDSSLTVHILDELTRLIDNKRVWLTSLSQQGAQLKMQGVAMDNETIAQLMNSLKTSKYIKAVSLGQSTLKGYSGRNLKSFNLTCNVGQPAKKEEEKQQ